MALDLVNRSYLVDQFDGFNKYALKDAYNQEVIDTPEAYLTATSTDPGALLIVADTTTPATGEVTISTVNAVTTGFQVGDYVTHQPKVSHYVTAYKNKYVKENNFADHFSSYTDEEIEHMFDGTKEEINYYASLIDDTKTSKYFLWSSSNTSDKIAASVVESNKYADNLVSGLANIQLKYVSTLPSVGVGNIIYILESTVSGTDPTLNLYDADSSTWKVIGSFNIDMTDYYTKTETNTKLDDYAKKTEALLTNDVETTPIDFSKNPWQ